MSTSSDSALFESDQPFGNWSLPLLLNQAPFALAIVEGPQLLIRYANLQFQSLFGRTRGQLTGHSFRQVWPEMEGQGLFELFEQALQRSQPSTTHDYAVHFSDRQTTKTVYVTFALQPIHPIQGQPQALMIQATDVTQSVTDRRLLKQSEERFMAAVSAVQGVLWTNNTRGEMEGPQPGWTALTGQSQREYQGYGWSKALHPDDVQPTIVAWQEAVAESRPFLFEHRVKRKDGSWGQFSIRAMPVHNPDGSIREWVGIHTDITQQRQAEDTLRQNAEELRTLFDESSVGKAQTDPNSRRFLRVNAALTRITGYSMAELLTMTVDELNHPDDRLMDRTHYQRLLQGQSYRVEKRYRRKDGQTIWVQVTSNVIHDASGTALRTVAVIEDITRRKQAEEALQVASQRKDEFLAMLAHELRNPLASIRLGMGLLNYGEDTDPIHQQTISLVNQQVDHLVRLVDELLDVSRISRGKIQLKPERVELRELVIRAVESLRPQYDALHKQLHLTESAHPVFVQGDPTRLSQVVTNLLTNGLRYTGGDGQVWVSLAVQDQQALLRVADNGIGLTPDQLTMIFEMFVQVDVSLARSQGGLGIGLTLVKQLVEMHGGRVEAHSRGLGQGSEFLVYLPLLEEPATDKTARVDAVPSPSARQRVLVIDDNPDLAFLLVQTLKVRGYEVYTQHSGREGIQAAEALRPRFILCDIGMPELDGYETCRLIRQQSWGQSVVLIAITGYGQEEDKRRAREAGFDAHLVKPVDLEDLMQLLSQ